MAEEIFNSFEKSSVKLEIKNHDDWIKGFGSYVNDLLI
jgi:hypothetical protein